MCDAVRTRGEGCGFRLKRWRGLRLEFGVWNREGAECPDVMQRAFSAYVLRILAKLNVSAMCQGGVSEHTRMDICV